MNDIFVVPLNNSDQICLIDSEDSARVVKYNWTFESKSGYVVAYNPNQNSFSLHRFIMRQSQYKDSKHVHHSSVVFDNRKSKLRIIKPNIHTYIHCAKRKNKNQATSKYIGVSWAKDRKRWRAGLNFEGKFLNLGRFLFDIDAALAYDRHARTLYGKDAIVNFTIS